MSIIGLRVFKLISHAKMKYVILKAIKFKRDLDLETFVSGIALKKRDLPVSKTNFDITILATGAPSCYASIIAKKEAFDYCISTDFPEQGFYDTYENIRNVKKNNVMNYLKSKDLETIDVFITDHLDDLPLIKVAKHNIIVNPGYDMLAELEKNLISFETIY